MNILTWTTAYNICNILLDRTAHIPVIEHVLIVHHVTERTHLELSRSFLSLYDARTRKLLRHLLRPPMTFLWWMWAPLNLFANAYNHSRPHFVVSHKSFITSGLASKIIKFPFLLCVSLPTDSRWGSRALDKQTRRNRGMSLLTVMGASLNCLRSGLAFVFWTDCRGPFFLMRASFIVLEWRHLIIEGS